METAVAAAMFFPRPHDHGLDDLLLLDRAVDGRAHRGHRQRVGVDIGTAAWPRDGETPEALLAHADAAMYASKLRGKNRYSLDSLLHVNGAA